MNSTRLLLFGLLLLPALARAQTTASFGYTGGSQAYTVPAGVTSLNVVATGGSSGGLNGNASSYGAQVTATVAVVPGDVLTVEVGGRGNRSTGQGGYNGGGSGGDGGGGATDLRLPATRAKTGDYLASRNALVVAGGGGGGSGAGAGGNGGTPNGAAGYPGSQPGQGATQTGPGSGGGSGSAGQNSVGGAGGGTFGGGGGGGYYGGGGGTDGDGGGGGSSFVARTGSGSIAYSVARAYGNGSLTITPANTPTPVVTAPTSGAVLNTLTPTYAGTALAGGTIEVFVDGTSIGKTSATSSNTFSLAQPAVLANGAHTVRATANGVVSSSPITFLVIVVAPTVATAPATSVTATGAVLGGSVSSEGTAAVTERGVVYLAGSGLPTLASSKASAGTGAGSFTAPVAGLVPGSAYTVRAYATSSVGTSYGSPVAFATAATTRVVSIARVGSGLTNAASVSYTVTFADAVTGLKPSNFALATTGSIAGASIASLAGSGTTYTVAVSTGTGDGTLALNLVSATGLAPGLAALPYTGEVYTIDKTPPTLIITSATAPNGGSSTNPTFFFVATFSEGVLNEQVFNAFIISSRFDYTFSLDLSTYDEYYQTGTRYTASINPNGVGAVTLSFEANAITDAAGNRLAEAVPYTIYYGTPTAAPVVTAPASGSLLNTPTPTYAGTAPAGSTVTVYVDGQALPATAPATGGTFSLAQPVGLPDGPHTVYATAQASGQLVSAAGAASTFTVDATPPTATLTSASGSSSTAPIPFAVSFSEAVTGFAASGITVSNGSVASGPTGSGSGPYTFSITPAGSGPVSVSLAAGAAHDAAGNGSLAAGPLSVGYAPPVAAGLRVQYQTGDLGQPTDGQVRPFLQLANAGPAAVPYSSLTVRYWLTVENYAPLVTPIDWAKLGTGYVSAHYVALPAPRQGAYGYIEYAFAAVAGSLAPGTDSGPIYAKAYKPDYSAFDETDDWSYQASSGFTANDHLTLYLDGTLVGGTEPPLAAPATALKVYAGNPDTSPTTPYISVQLQVANVGNQPVRYADLRVRYWFTPDGPQPLVYQVDYARLGSQHFGLQTGQAGTQPYAELSFADDLGTFYPASSTGDIQFKIRKDDYSAFTQSNDYSFGGSAAVVEQPRLTAYLNGQLIFGTEPAGAAPAAALRAGPPTRTAAASSGATPATEPLEQRLTGSPNPFADQLQLQFALPYTQAYALALYDGQGRLVRQLPGGTAPAGQVQRVTLPAQELAAGLYLVRLTTATDRQQLKFIKQ